ncbi:MAG: hypothetical protein OHK0040_08680 [bacterium]
MNNYLKDITVREIESQFIEDSRDYWLLYEGNISDATMIFYSQKGKYYPVVSSIKPKLITGNVKAIVSENLFSLAQFVISVRGIDNLSFVDKLLLSRVSDAFNLTEINTQKYITLLNLPDDALFLLSKNRMSPDLALKLLSCHIDDIHFFVEITEKLKLNINLQKELFNFLSSKTKNNANSFKDILTSVAKNALELPAEDLFTKIRKKTMPEYTDFKEKFTELKRSLALPQRINLVESPFFESKNMKIEIFFKTFDELSNATKDLQSNIEQKKPFWLQIFKMM